MEKGMGRKKGGRAAEPGTEPEYEKAYLAQDAGEVVMTEYKAKSCIQTIELLRRLAYNVHGVMDVIDDENCNLIINLLKSQPEIVRCKDCKNYDDAINECADIGSPCYRNGWCEPDWYCADGQHK